MCVYLGQQITEYVHACHIHIYLHLRAPAFTAHRRHRTVAWRTAPWFHCQIHTPPLILPRRSVKKLWSSNSTPRYTFHDWNPFFLVQFVLAIQDSLAMCRFQLHRSTVRGDDQKRNGASGVSIEVLFFLLFLQSFSFSSSSSPSSFTHQSWMSLVLS